VGTDCTLSGASIQNARPTNITGTSASAHPSATSTSESNPATAKNVMYAIRSDCHQHLLGDTSAYATQNMPAATKPSNVPYAALMANRGPY
jgi:hypothetical protein